MPIDSFTHGRAPLPTEILSPRPTHFLQSNCSNQNDLVYIISFTSLRQLCLVLWRKGLTLQPRLTQNSPSSCLSLLTVHHRTGCHSSVFILSRPWGHKVCAWGEGMGSPVVPCWFSLFNLGLGTHWRLSHPAGVYPTAKYAHGLSCSPGVLFHSCHMAQWVLDGSLGVVDNWSESSQRAACPSSPGGQSCRSGTKGPGLFPGVGTNERRECYGNGVVGSLPGRPNVNRLGGRVNSHSRPSQLGSVAKQLPPRVM